MVEVEEVVMQEDQELQDKEMQVEQVDLQHLIVVVVAVVEQVL